MMNQPLELKWEFLEKAHAIYLKVEPRDAMYSSSTKLLESYWGNEHEVATALGVLLLTWNSSFYRFGDFSYDLIEDALSRNIEKLEELRKRDITTLDPFETDDINLIFNDMLYATRSVGRKYTKNEGRISYSPVSVGKALHLLCPDFFPLWDSKIAENYRCKWKDSQRSHNNYMDFIKIASTQVKTLQGRSEVPKTLSGTGILKLIDEYNYVRFTKNLITSSGEGINRGM